MVTISVSRTENRLPNLNTVHLAVIVLHLTTVAECDTTLIHGNIVVTKATECHHIVAGDTRARSVNLIVTRLSVNDQLTIAFVTIGELDRDNRYTSRPRKVAIDSERGRCHTIHDTALHATVTHRGIYIEIERIGISIASSGLFILAFTFGNFISILLCRAKVSILVLKLRQVICIHRERINVSARSSRLFCISRCSSFFPSRFSFSRSISSRRFRFSRTRFLGYSRSIAFCGRFFTCNRCFSCSRFFCRGRYVFRNIRTTANHLRISIFAIRLMLTYDNFIVKFSLGKCQVSKFFTFSKDKVILDIESISRREIANNFAALNSNGFILIGTITLELLDFSIHIINGARIIRGFFPQII